MENKDTTSINENTISIAETLKLILSFDENKIFESLLCIRSIYEVPSIKDALKMLSEQEQIDFIHRIESQNQEISKQLSALLTLDDKGLLKGLSHLRLEVCREILIASANLLTRQEAQKLKKMVILQNIATKGTTERPWEQKGKSPKPMRRSPAKDLIYI